MPDEPDWVAITGVILGGASLLWQVWSRVFAPRHEARVQRHLRREERQENALRDLKPRAANVAVLCDLFEDASDKGDEAEVRKLLPRIQQAMRGLLGTWDMYYADIYDRHVKEALKHLEAPAADLVENAPSVHTIGLGEAIRAVRDCGRAIRDSARDVLNG